MEIRIGVQHSPREIVVESEETEADVMPRVESAMAAGEALTLRDGKGRTVLVPGAKIAYVEISTDQPRRVGFLG
ncbi:DUF3107 domain-containing protein [Devriesea agamarum]|uniref:DUF3107 domain-containing protein n=1 Tax=Devriesea agamarum TaxID=472569 RepID=UPI00071C43B8|nr:DUF3107 domain-containing protein [Devriesea agamarum]